ncbi:hypothetical protein CYMTET_32247 [Cymbomonas tetramitiformis]|uniref:Uncharacterized protein n=1 Tax=Cymbomonas tetramitiformis TaxID=36881 RepID=A0AAE0FFS5_9CHLO|nr:hypothetical protein CYMTET_32247 [Cymbomonas tetramitiformis]
MITSESTFMRRSQPRPWTLVAAHSGGGGASRARGHWWRRIQEEEEPAAPVDTGGGGRGEGGKATVVDGVIEELAPADNEEALRMLVMVTMLVTVPMTLDISGMSAACAGRTARRPEAVDEMETMPAAEIVMDELDLFEDVTVGSNEMGPAAGGVHSGVGGDPRDMARTGRAGARVGIDEMVGAEGGGLTAGHGGVLRR